MSIVPTVLLPPWKEFPTLPQGCLGWRMGGGESYLHRWYLWIETLTQEQRISYFQAHCPLPFEWLDTVAYVFGYEDYDDSLSCLPSAEELTNPESLAGIRWLAAQKLCDFDEVAAWSNQRRELYEQVDAFEEGLYTCLVTAIQSWDIQNYSDIYALALLYSTSFLEDSEGQLVTLDTGLTLHFNTRSQVKSQIAKGISAAEARWNIAHWIPNAATALPPCTQENTLDAAAWDQYQAYLTIRVDKGRRDLDTPEKALLFLYTRLANRLREERIVSRTLGRRIPLLIHNLTYDTPGIIATKEANPRSLLTGFLAFWQPS